eukprot:SAG31_NODE_638_length_13329_cov_13.538095_14_plen_119_part_00
MQSCKGLEAEIYRVPQSISLDISVVDIIFAFDVLKILSEGYAAQLHATLRIFSKPQNVAAADYGHDRQHPQPWAERLKRPGSCRKKVWLLLFWFCCEDLAPAVDVRHSELDHLRTCRR